MKTNEINESLIGKRVNGIFTATKVSGTIIGIVNYYAKKYDRKTYELTNEEYLCATGVKIKLDFPVRWGDDIYTEYESTARICDDWGNLSFTELIN